MSEVSTRPQKAAKATHTPAKANRAPAPAAQNPEAEDLQAQALHILMYVSTDLAEANLTNIPGALHAATEANNIAYCMCHPEDSASEPPTVLDGLTLICHHLDAVGLHLAAAEGHELHSAISAAALLDHTQQLARRLHAAIVGLPGTIEDLRALTTYAGAKPYRDRPTPPIRRAPAALLEHGKLSRAQLQLFVEVLAGELGTIDDLLKMAQSCDEDWQHQRLLDAGQSMVQNLGAIVDHASGGKTRGSIGRWFCGPFFEELGGAEA